MRDWRANRLTDKLAKAAASFRAPPRDLLKLLKAAAGATEHAGACLGLTTFAANNYRETSWRPDGTAVAALHRDAWLPPYLDRGAGHRPRATGSRQPDHTDEAKRTAEAHAENGDAEHHALEAAARAQRAHAKAATARAREATRLKADEAEARGLQTWLADKAAGAATRATSTTSAAERMEALRQRVAARASMAPNGP